MGVGVGVGSGVWVGVGGGVSVAVIVGGGKVTRGVVDGSASVSIGNCEAVVSMLAAVGSAGPPQPTRVISKTMIPNNIRIKFERFCIVRQ